MRVHRQSGRTPLKEGARRTVPEPAPASSPMSHEKKPAANAAGQDRVSRASQAYSEIRRRILNAQLSPAESVSEYQLAAELGLSRTPIREALKRLEREGLIQSVLGRGAYVAELSFQDVLEIYEVRLLLEPFAAGVAAKQMSEGDISTLGTDVAAARKAAAAGRLDDAFRLDIRLHKSLVAATRNGRIAGILSQLDDQVHRIRVLAPHTPGRLDATIDEHQAIVTALAAHDVEGAERAMRQHLLAARANAIQLALPMPFERITSQMPSPLVTPRRKK
jgi:DNA-binding GntR family transcriptional regulator